MASQAMQHHGASPDEGTCALDLLDHDCLCAIFDHVDRLDLMNFTVAYPRTASTCNKLLGVHWDLSFRENYRGWLWTQLKLFKLKRHGDLPEITGIAIDASTVASRFLEDEVDFARWYQRIYNSCRSGEYEVRRNRREANLWVSDVDPTDYCRGWLTYPVLKAIWDASELAWNAEHAATYFDVDTDDMIRFVAEAARSLATLTALTIGERGYHIPQMLKMRETLSDFDLGFVLNCQSAGPARSLLPANVTRILSRLLQTVVDDKIGLLHLAVFGLDWNDILPMQALLEIVYPTLRSLKLAMRVTEPFMPTEYEDRIPLREALYDGDPAPPPLLLHLCQNLTMLKLRFRKGPNSVALTGRKLQEVTESFKDLHLQHLRCFHLRSSRIESEVLVQFMERHRHTLKDVLMRDLSVQHPQGGWLHAIMALRDTKIPLDRLQLIGNSTLCDDLHDWLVFQGTFSCLPEQTLRVILIADQRRVPGYMWRGWYREITDDGQTITTGPPFRNDCRGTYGEPWVFHDDNIDQHWSEDNEL